MPLDITLFRTEGGNPELIRESQRRRFASVELVDEIIAKDNEWRALTGQADNHRKARNAVQKDIATHKKAVAQAAKDASINVAEHNAKCDELLQQKNALDKEIAETEDKQGALKVVIDSMVNKIGNLVLDSVPVGNDEDTGNRVERRWGSPRDPKGLLNHHDLLWRIGGYEPERGSNVVGHRGYFLRDVGVLLNQAFINYGIAFLRKRNYCVLQPPYMMKKDVMAGVAQLEQFDEELYKVSGGANSDPSEDRYLIATSEQPICAYHKDEWMDEKALPLRYAGVSTCFRKEAGSHGKDTWGIFRVHQFEKVEQFAIVEGDLETSNKMQEEMIAAAEEFYQSLGFPYQVINIVSGALNNAAIRKLDLECWFPGYNAYRELVSCSNCTDYQSRAMEIRCGIKKLGDREKKYVHMLNATLCATGRAICCLLETYQEADGVRVPEVLVPFMGGITFLPFVRDARGAEKTGPAAAPAAKPVAVPKAAPAPAAAAADAVPPAAPAAATAAAAPVEEKKKEKKEKKEKAPKVEEPQFAKIPENVRAPPAYVTPAPLKSSQDSGVSGEEDEGVPAVQDVLGDALAVDLAKLNERLSFFSYVAGDAPAAVDNTVFAVVVVQELDAKVYPNIARWLRHVQHLGDAVRATWH